MGVQIYLLDRRTTALRIGDFVQKIGTLRRSWKVTEIDESRLHEIETAQANFKGKPAPAAAMVADVSELPVAEVPNRLASAHLVLGWDADRSSVTDFGWEHLPILGYAVRAAGSTEYRLHEERTGVLYPVTYTRAIELGIFDLKGNLLRQGQPSIIKCSSVRRYISGYAQAECALSNGITAEILTAIEPEHMPRPEWYIGKRPSDVSNYSRATTVR